MGQAVDGQATRRGHTRAAALGRAEASRLADLAGSADVAFEFTAPDAAEANVIALLRANLAVVCGTTGWSATPALERALAESSAGAVIAANFSPGMWAFERLVRRAGGELGRLGLHRPWILEVHHTGKKDAPSGTALGLARVLLDVDPRLARIVAGNADGGLPEDALHVASLRAESEPGTHTVGFDGTLDRITLSHRAAGREGFALGAVLAAEWLRGRRGLHGIEDVMEQLLSEPEGRA
jgi:4-hydroxy-tetrahydrodipicolinate reductase